MDEDGRSFKENSSAVTCISSGNEQIFKLDPSLFLLLQHLLCSLESLRSIHFSHKKRRRWRLNHIENQVDDVVRKLTFEWLISVWFTSFFPLNREEEKESLVSVMKTEKAMNESHEERQEEECVMIRPVVIINLLLQELRINYRLRGIKLRNHQWN